MVHPWYKCDDPLNRKQNRNVTNTAENSYNCGGYALRTFSWYWPHDGGDEIDELIDDMYYAEGESVGTICEVVTDLEVAYMLEEFGDTLRVIHSETDAGEGEEAIQFRVLIQPEEDNEWVNNDYHFRVLRDGVWMEKNGDRSVKEVTDRDTLPNGNWISPTDKLEYNGPIVWLAHRI